MSARQKGLVVLAIQLALVLSIAVKYSWERHTSPMVWARTQQWDPAGPLRGRYLALNMYANACGLEGGTRGSDFVRKPGPESDYTRNPGGSWQPVEAMEWHVIPAVRNGELTATVVDAPRPGPTEQLMLDRAMPCEYARLSGVSNFFIPEHAKSPFPLQKGQELWALVTVPPSGPVRPVKLAISDATGFHVLNLD